MSEPEAPGVKAGKQFLEANFSPRAFDRDSYARLVEAAHIALHNSLRYSDCCNQSADCDRRQCPRARA